MSVAKSSLWFSLGTFFSRITGLVRDAVVTGVFGATSSFESFLIAYRIPNLFREMLAEGALGSAFTKVFSALSEEDEARAQELLKAALRMGILLLIGICIVGYVGAPLLVKLFTLTAKGSGRPESFVSDAVGLTRILFPFLGFTLLASIVMGVLHQRGKFFVASLSPVMLNLGYIFGALVLATVFFEHESEWIGEAFSDAKVVGLTVGVLLGGFLHFAIQFWVVLKDLRGTGFRWSFFGEFYSPDVRNIFKIMAPAAVAASAPSINLVVNTNFAAGLQTGSITWLSYGFRLMQLPVGLFAVGVGAAALPALTRAVTRAGRKVDKDVNRELQNAVHLILWLMAPCFCFLFVNHLPLVQLLFQHGKFSAVAAEQTANALYAYSFGVIGYGLVKVLTAFYFAVERTSFAMIVSLVSIAVNFICNYILVGYYGHVGLAATAAITLTCNSLLLWVGLRVSQVAFSLRNLLKTLSFIVVTGLLAVYAQRFCLNVLAGLDLGGFASVKSKAFVSLCGSGFVLVFVFAAGVLSYLQWSPRYALGQVKSKWKRPQ